MSTYYLTTATPYPSGEPHVGRSFEMIAADAVAPGGEALFPRIEAA